MSNPTTRFFRRLQKKLMHFFEDVRNGDKISIAILVCAILLVVALLVLAICLPLLNRQTAGQPASAPVSQSESTSVPVDDFVKEDAEIEVSEYDGVILPQTADAGDTYLRETLFIGDSNTARMLLYGPATLENTLGAASMGIQHVTSTACIYFSGYAQPVKVAKAVSLMQPRRIVINYGTNNTSSSVETFIKGYKAALDAIRDAYEYADITIAAVLPVAQNRQYPAITMQKIAEFNKALVELAKQENCTFLNTTEAISDTTGYANPSYMLPDGIHLTEQGMAAYFEYVRTHALSTEDRRPALQPVPKHLATPDSFFGGTGDVTTTGGSSSSSGSKASFSLTGATLSVGGSAQLNASDYKPDFSAFSGKPVTWASSDTAIVTVNGDGVVTGVKAGTATITCTIGTVSASTTVTVKDAPVIITISGPSSVGAGQTIELKLAVSPENYAGARAVTWTSSDPNIAIVNAENGAVTGVKEGVITVTASMDGKATTTYKVTVSHTHSFGDWVVTTAPTCGAPGTQTRTCTACGQTETQEIPATGAHTFGSTDPATGKQTCSVCGAVQQDPNWSPASSETPPPPSSETPPPASSEAPPPVSSEAPPPASSETPPPASSEAPPAPSSSEAPPEAPPASTPAA